MSIIWLIIKIICISLLSIIGLVLVVLGIILLAPIRYEAYWAKYETLSYDINVTYLWGIKGNFYLDKGKKNHRISIFGRVLYKNEEQQVLNKDTMPKAESVRNESKINPQLKKVVKSNVVQAEDAIKDESAETIEKISPAWAKEVLLNKQTYGAIKQICKCIWCIIKTIWPREWDFELIVGEEDPADTGELIAKLTMLYPLYYQHGIIQGNYEKACLEGGFLAKGGFTIGHIIWHVIRCVCSHSVRWFIKFIMELRKEEQNGK